MTSSIVRFHLFAFFVMSTTANERLHRATLSLGMRKKFILDFSVMCILPDFTFTFAVSAVTVRSLDVLFAGLQRLE